MIPALFLHGFTGAGDAWAPFTDGCDAICPDLPGHRGAPLPDRMGRAGFDATIAALADRLSRPSAVIGYSQGARLALALAVRHPEKVTHLILESGTAGLARHHDRALRQAEDEARASMLETHGLDAFLRYWEALPMFAGVPRDRHGHTADGLAGALRCLGLGVQPSFWAELPRLRVPTLLITGARDQKFTALARRMAAELPMAWHAIVPDAGHTVHLEAPQRWLEEVRSFTHNQEMRHDPRMES